MPEEPPDRFHNREADSPESLRRSIDALAEAVSALDRKLDDTTIRLGADVDRARATARHLASDVAMMGEALVRRIEEATLPPAIATPPKPRRRNAFAWIAGLAALLAGAVAALVLLRGAPDRTSVARPPPVPAAAAPVVQTAPIPAPVAATPRPPGAALTHSPRAKIPHAWRPHHKWRPPVVDTPVTSPAEPSDPLH